MRLRERASTASPTAKGFSAAGAPSSTPTEAAAASSRGSSGVQLPQTNDGAERQPAWTQDWPQSEQGTSAQDASRARERMVRSSAS